MLQLAVLPSIILFVIVWRADKTEKEPFSLLVKLFIFGALTTVSAMVLGSLGEDAVLSLVDEESLVYVVIDNFILTALIEEGGKYFVLKKATWRHPAFNYTFDAVVYAVVASLGFATVENILYVMDEDISVAIMRGLLSVPGHVTDAIFMGCFYGAAKAAAEKGDRGRAKLNLRRALFIPVLLHGFYDFCLSTGSDFFLLVFFAFEIIVTVLAVRTLRKLSREDRAIPAGEDAAGTH